MWKKQTKGRTSHELWALIIEYRFATILRQYRKGAQPLHNLARL